VFKKTTLAQKQMIFGYIFISPWIIGFIWFFVFNMIKAIQFSLNKVIINPTGGYSLEFIGLDNFVFAITQDAEFNRILVESITNMLLDVPLITFFSLFMAILLNQRFHGRVVVRAIFFLPVILLSSAIVGAFDSAQNLLSGGVTSIPPEMMQQEGFNVRALIGTFADFGFPPYILEYIAGAVSRVYDIVRASGVQILIFLASLQAIPGSLYEVAKIEGATTYETFWKITFPMVSPLILTNVIYTIIDSFTVSDVVDTAYVTAFTEFNFGLSSAMSLLSAIFVSVVLLVIGIAISKKTFYQN